MIRENEKRRSKCGCGSDVIVRWRSTSSAVPHSPRSSSLNIFGTFGTSGNKNNSLLFLSLSLFQIMSSKKEPQSQVPAGSKGSWSSFLKVGTSLPLYTTRNLPYSLYQALMVVSVYCFVQRRPFFSHSTPIHSILYFPNRIFRLLGRTPRRLRRSRQGNRS